MLKLIIPDSKEKIQQQVRALEYVICHDTNNKDKEIHKDALSQIKKMFLEN